MENIKGIPFYDVERQFFKSYLCKQENQDLKKLTASSLVTYLLIRSLGNELGLIDETTLNLKVICEEVDLPYNSVHNGYHRLFDIGAIRIVLVRRRPYIELSILTMHLLRKHKIYNGFCIRHEIFQGNYLRKCIKSRNVYELLDILQVK